MVGQNCVPDVLGNAALLADYGQVAAIISAKVPSATKPSGAVGIHVNAIYLSVRRRGILRIQPVGAPGRRLQYPQAPARADVQRALSVRSEAGLAQERDVLAQIHRSKPVALKTGKSVAGAHPNGSIGRLVERFRAV